MKKETILIDYSKLEEQVLASHGEIDLSTEVPDFYQVMANKDGITRTEAKSKYLMDYVGMKYGMGASHDLTNSDFSKYKAGPMTKLEPEYTKAPTKWQKQLMEFSEKNK